MLIDFDCIYNDLSIQHWIIPKKWYYYPLSKNLEYVYPIYHFPSSFDSPEIREYSLVVMYIKYFLDYSFLAKQLSPFRRTWHSSLLTLLDIFFHQSFFSLGKLELNCNAVNHQLTRCPLPWAESQTFWFSSFHSNQNCLFCFAYLGSSLSWHCYNFLLLIYICVWLWVPPCSIFYTNFFKIWALRTLLYRSSLFVCFSCTSSSEFFAVI